MVTHPDEPELAFSPARRRRLTRLLLLRETQRRPEEPVTPELPAQPDEERP